LCVQSSFVPFMEKNYPSLFRCLKNVSDPYRDDTANFRFALAGSVCLVCRKKVCEKDVCKVCYRTPEGKAKSLELRVKKSEATNIDRWDAANPMSSEKGKAHYKKKVFEKLGVENAMLLKSVQRKHQKSIKDSHNTEEYKTKASLIRQQPGFMDKVVASSRKTSLERYGVTNPMLCVKGRQPWEKATKKWRTEGGRAETGKRAKEAVQKKYGVNNGMELDWVKAKMRQTWLDNYGVDHPLKDMTIRKKALTAALSSRFKVKKFTCSGKEFAYMGYERPAIEECVRRYGVKSVLANGEIEPIRYNERLYFPDLRIESKDTFIEVKSLWTMFSSRRSFTFCKEKASGVSGAGVNLRWMLCSDAEVLAVLPQDWYKLKPKAFISSLHQRLSEKHKAEFQKYIGSWNKHEGRVHH
jgi:hypothetical protein